MVRVIRTDWEELLAHAPQLVVVSVLAAVTLRSPLPGQIWWLLVGFFGGLVFEFRGLRRVRAMVRAGLENAARLPDSAVEVSALSRLPGLYLTRRMLLFYAPVAGFLVVGYKRNIWPGMCATMAGLVLGFVTITAVGSVMVFRWERQRRAVLFEPETGTKGTVVLYFRENG